MFDIAKFKPAPLGPAHKGRLEWACGCHVTCNGEGFILTLYRCSTPCPVGDQIAARISEAEKYPDEWFV